MTINAQASLGGGEQEATLTDAILLRKIGQGWGQGGRSAFATVHPITREGRGSSKLGPGRLLTTGELADLVSGLWGQTLRYLPENLVAQGPGTIAWWEPARQRPLFFKTGDKYLDGLSGGLYPQPPLLFIASSGSLRMHALPANARPAPETTLMVAPYYNVFNQGQVCIGSMPLPDEVDVAAVSQWSDNFFASYFTHGNVGQGKLLKHEGSYGQFWATLRDGETFPLEALVPDGRTFKEALGV
jgi:PRTRC genetic system protein B